MGAIFVVLFIGLILVKHVGATIRESYQNNCLKNVAIQRGDLTYWAADGHRYVHNNHLTTQTIDPYLGSIIIDRQTGQKYYESLEKFKQDYKDNPDRKCLYDPSMWEGKIGRTTAFIDKNTGEICYLARADASHDMNHVAKWGKIHFYVDLSRKHIIRRTPSQLIRDEREGIKYTDKQLNDYVDKFAFRVDGPCFRDRNGLWKPVDSEYAIS